METPKTPWNSYFMTVLLCGLAGAFVASWLAPKAIAWYFEPPVNIGINCRPATEWSMSRLQTAQLSGLGIGTIAGIMLTIVWTRRGKRLE